MRKSTHVNHLVNKKYRVAILISSDACYQKERKDLCGSLMIKQLFDYEVIAYQILPDEQHLLSDMMCHWCDDDHVDLILTSGGTGLSLRDVMPEATRAIMDKDVPGIAEYLRFESMQITKRAMFTRMCSVIRKSTLIINLPGSPKAVEETLAMLLPHLEHGLDVLSNNVHDCARK